MAASNKKIGGNLPGPVGRAAENIRNQNQKNLQNTLGSQQTATKTATIQQPNTSQYTNQISDLQNQLKALQGQMTALTPKTTTQTLGLPQLPNQLGGLNTAGKYYFDPNLFFSGGVS